MAVITPERREELKAIAKQRTADLLAQHREMKEWPGGPMDRIGPRGGRYTVATSSQTGRSYRVYY